MYKIKFTDAAIQDLWDIESFISKDSPMYANKVIDKIILTISNLADFPHLGKSIEDDNLWIIIEPRYGFSIVYEILWKTITIFSVFKYRNGWK